MKQAKTPPPDQDAMRPEYDFTGGVRGKHAAAMRQGSTRMVHHADGTREITTVRPLEGSIGFPEELEKFWALALLAARLPERA